MPVSIAVLLCMSYLPYPVSGGENQYLAMAKQFVNPNWIPNSFSLTEFPGTRILFQYIFGWPLQWFSIETGALIFRAFNFFLIGFPLYRILSYLKLKNLTILLLIQIFITGQSQLGGEWMIGTFEPKTISYVFFMWAFWFWLQQRFYRMVLFGVLACYFHVIVGGWFFIAAGLISLFQNQWKNLLKPAALAILLLAPFFYYLLPLFSQTTEASPRSADYIYAYVRLSNHLGIARSWQHFTHFHLKGTVITLVLFVLSFALQRKIPPQLKPWIRTGFGVCLVYVGIAMVDSFMLDKQASLGLKFYPFRLNSFSYFLVLVSLVLWAQSQLESHWKIVKWLFLLGVLGLTLGKGIDSYKRKIKFLRNSHPNINQWVKENTHSSDIFLLDIRDSNGKYYQNFTRLTERENYSVFKFIPAEKEKILEWDRRQKIVNSVIQSGENSVTELTDEKINFIISEKVLSTEPIYSAEGLSIYKITN